MAMTSLYRGSAGLVGPVGARPREPGHRAHHFGRRVAAAKVVVAKPRGGPLAAPGQERRQAATTGLEASIRLGRLLEGSGDGRGGQVARDPFLEKLLMETAAADAA